MFLYLRRYLSYRQVVVFLETFQTFSTVGPLTKDCQSNVADGLGVYKNRSDFCCGVLCCLCYLQEWILILYRHLCLKYTWSGRLFRPSCVFVIRLSQFLYVRLYVQHRHCLHRLQRTLSDRSKSSAAQLNIGQMDGGYWSNAVFEISLVDPVCWVYLYVMLLRGVSTFARYSSDYTSWIAARWCMM